MFPATLLSMFLHRIQAHSLLQTQPPLQLRRCNCPIYYKKIKNLCPNSFKLPFFRKNTPEANFAAETENFNSFAKSVFAYITFEQYFNFGWQCSWKIYIRPLMSIFHEHCQPKLKYCSNVIYWSDHKLGSLQWEIGALPIRYRINKSSKPLLNIDKLTFTKSGKS